MTVSTGAGRRAWVPPQSVSNNGHLLTQHSRQCTCLVSKRSPVQSWPPAPYAGLAQLGRASVLQTEGHRFEPYIPHQRTITKTPPSRERRRMIKTRPSAEQGHIVTAADKTSLILVIILIRVGDQLPFTLVQTIKRLLQQHTKHLMLTI